MMTLPVWQEVPHDQLNHPFLVPPGVVGVVAPDGGVLASLLSDLISCKSLSFVSFCIFSSYSLTSLIVISYQSSILDLEMKKYDDFTKKKLFNFSVKSISRKTTQNFVYYSDPLKFHLELLTRPLLVYVQAKEYRA